MELELILRTSAILACAALVSRLLTKAAAETRHLLWHLAIILSLLAPVLAPLAPRIEIPQIDYAMVTTTATAAPIDTNTSIARRDTLSTIRSLGRLGTIFTLSWFVMAWIASEVSVRRARRAPTVWMSDARTVARKLGVRSEIDIRESRHETSPQVAGFFRSVILLPPSAAEWSADDRRAALAHEITHIRRHDRRTQALAQAACAIYWFNPLVWYAAASLSRERERACDAAALSLGARPSDYASLLLGLARRGQDRWVSSAALTMARPSAIEGRLLKILGGDVRMPWASSRWVVLACALVCTGIVLGAQQSAPVATQESTAVGPAPRRVSKDLILQDDPERPSAITSALVSALGDRSAQVREHAALGLALSPGSAVIAPLLTALKDSDAQVREKAAIGLAFRRDPRIVEPLLSAINDSDAQVREKAAIALGASGDERAAGALTRATRDPDSQVREKAVAGLVLLGLRK